MSRSQWLRSSLVLVTGFVALSAAGCGGTAAIGSQAAPPPPTVKVAAVERRDVSLTSEWVATMDGYVNAQIQPHVSGYLVRQNYREGSFVHKGDVLFEIDQRPFQAILDQNQAQLAQAQAQVIQSQAQLAKSDQDVKRDTPLAEAKAIAQSQLDNDLQAKAGAAAAVGAAQAAVKAAEAAVEQAQLNLSFTKITSPVDGVAGLAQAQLGDLVATTTILTSVSQLDPIKVYFPITEQDYLHAQKIGRATGKQATPLAGVPLTLVLANNSVYPFQGKVLWTDRQVDASTGTLRIAASFPNHDNILRPGGYGRVRAATDQVHNALLVPQAAVTELQGTYQVALISGDNKVKIQNVQVGSHVGSDWVVTQGLNAGDRVVVEGMQYARDGALVHPELVATASGGH